MSFSQNNLDQAISPYLYQHRDNPVWWQEWSNEALEYARETDRILFVSVGYATCHWCHVMAAEAFSDPDVAAYINKWFMPIKVDREQRPDIDQVMMQFLVATTGQGGWPLNAFLSPSLEPFFAMTYAPTHARAGMPGFLEILQKVRSFYDQNRASLRPLSFQDTLQRAADETAPAELTGLSDEIAARFDHTHGGLAGDPKFPPHSSLLFLMYQPEPLSEPLRSGIEHTFDAMLERGLHDHLQGGFYRYCVDRNWTIPHFEKMLYDQAMMLWNLSLAYHRFGRRRYREAAVGVVRCLEDSFRSGTLFVSAHDADTDHEEGETYLWSYGELEEALSASELELFERRYAVSKAGNFEGRNHLVRHEPGSADTGGGDDADGSDAGSDASSFRESELRKLAEIEERLLKRRRGREQPAVDRKRVTSWNALAAIALLHAGRYGIADDGVSRASEIFAALMSRHYRADILAHSSIGGRLQRQEFLEDYGALALLASFLLEERQAEAPGRTAEQTQDLEALLGGMQRFKRNGGWIDAENEDFVAVPADTFDHPTPTGRALALWAETRAALLLSRTPVLPQAYGSALYEDGYNCAVMVTHGEFHQLETPEHLPWDRLPNNTIQLASDQLRYCYRGACRSEVPQFVFKKL